MENDTDGIRPAPTMYYVYVLKNHMTRRLYYGYTNDLRRRIGEHDRRRDGELVHYEAYKAKADTVRRERKLKDYGNAVVALKERLTESLV